MYCLDTNIAIDHLRGDLAVSKKLLQLQSIGVELAITSITLCELYKGAYLSEREEENLTAIDVFLGAVLILFQNKPSCVIFGRDYAVLHRRGTPTQEKDLMIASICKANSCALITRNAKDFKNVPDLIVSSWQ